LFVKSERKREKERERKRERERERERERKRDREREREREKERERERDLENTFFPELLRGVRPVMRTPRDLVMTWHKRLHLPLLFRSQNSNLFPCLAISNDIQQQQEA
jgi:hypothetical protein